MYLFFFFNDTATTEIYTLSLHGRSSDLEKRNLHCREISFRNKTILRQDFTFRIHFSFRKLELGLILARSEEHTSELQSQSNLVCRLLLEKKKNILHHPASYTHTATTTAY